MNVIKDGVETAAIIQQIFTIASVLNQKSKDIKSNFILCNHLSHKVDDIRNLITEYQLSQVTLDSANLIQLNVALEKALNYIQKYTSESYFKKLLNVVAAEASAEEIFEIDEEIDRAITNLVGSSEISTRLKLTWDGISEDTLEIFRQEIRNIHNSIKKLEPLAYNPYRDILLAATTTGKNFTKADLVRFNDLLDVGDQSSLCSMFRSTKSRTNDELEAYYDKHYPNEDINVETLIAEAIKCKQNGSIEKYFQEPAQFFFNKILSIKLPDVYKHPYINGEIVFCERQDSALIFHLPLETNMRIITVQQVSNGNGFVVTVKKFYCQKLSSFLRHLEAPIPDCSVKLLLRKNSLTSDGYILPEKDYILKIQKENTVTAGLSIQNTRWKFKLIDNSNSLGSNVYVLHYDGGKDVTFTQYVADKKNNKTNKSTPKAIPLISLDIYELRIEEKAPFPQMLLTPSEIEIKEKRVSDNQLKFLLLEKLSSLRKEIIDQLSEIKSADLDSILFYLNENNQQQSSPDSLFFDNWIRGLDNNIQANISELFDLYGKMTQHESTDSVRSPFILLIEIVYLANRLRLLKSRSDSRDCCEIMDRLAIAVDYLEGIKNKDVVLFVGDTGAGKSTAINYFSGIRLEFDEDNLNRVRVAQSSANDFSKIAEIGVFSSISQTVYVRGYPIHLQKLKDFYSSNKVDIADLLLGDCPGFHDTHGEGYDLTAALSISRAIKLARSVKAIVIVIPEKDFRSGKCRGVIESFEKLEELFTKSFDKLPDKDRANIRLIISHSERDQTIKVRSEIKSLITSCYKESLTLAGDAPQDAIKKRIWDLINEISEKERLLVIDISNYTDRSNWLKECISTENKGISKELMRPLLDMSSLHRSFANIITSSLYIWESLLLRRYLDLTKKPQVMQTKITTQREKREGILKLIQKTNELKQNKILQKEEMENEIVNLERLLKHDDGHDSNEELNKLIKSIQEKAKARNNEDIRQKKEQIAANQAVINKLQEENQEFMEFKNTKNDAKLGADNSLKALEKEEKDLSTGCSLLELCYLKSFKYDDPWTEATFWGKIKEFVINLIQSDTPTSKIGDCSGERTCLVTVQLDYRSVQQNQLAAFLNGETIITPKGNYTAIITTNQVELIPREVKGNGKIICFKAKLTFVAHSDRLQWKAPYFKIEHEIPNKEIHEEELRNKSSDKKLIQEYLISLQTEIAEVTDKIIKNQREIINSSALIQQWEGELKELEKMEYNNVIKDLIQTQNKSLAICETEIITCKRQIADYESSILAIDTKIEEYQINYQLVRLEQFRLATVIIRDLHIAENWKLFAEQANDNNSDVSSAIRYSENENKSDRLQANSRRFVEFFKENIASIVTHATELLKNQEFQSSGVNQVMNQVIGAVEEKCDENGSEVDELSIKSSSNLLTSTSLSSALKVKENLAREKLLVDALQFDWLKISSIFLSTSTELKSLDIRDPTEATSANSNPPLAESDIKYHLNKYFSVSSPSSTSASASALVLPTSSYEIDLKSENGYGNYFFDLLIGRLKDIGMNNFETERELIQSFAELLSSKLSSLENEEMEDQPLNSVIEKFFQEHPISELIIQVVAILTNINIIIFHLPTITSATTSISIFQPISPDTNAKTICFGEIPSFRYFNIKTEVKNHPVLLEQLRTAPQVAEFFLDFCGHQKN